MDALQRFLLNVKRHAEAEDGDSQGRWYRLTFDEYGVLVKLGGEPGELVVLDTYTYNA